jgi:tetratricopeptide (TPR) repeat protein
VLGSGHVDTLWTINNLALVLDQHGEPDAALVLFEDAYEGFRAALGPDNPTTLRVQNNLGDFACRYGLRSGRRELLTRAETVLSAVLTARRRTLPPNHRDVLQSVNDLAVVLLANRRPDEAGPLLTEALAGRRKELGAGHPDTLQTVTNYAQFLRGKKRTAEAIGECEDALTAAKKAGMAEHPEALKLMCTLIELLVFNKQRLPEALPHAQTALSLSIKVNGESHDETLRARRNLGAVLLDLNRPEDAEPHLRAVHAACLRSDAAHARTALAAGKVGACLLAQKRYEEAEPLLVGCYERLHAVPNAPKATVRAACEQVVQLYDAWGKSEKAAEWRERLK